MNLHNKHQWVKTHVDHMQGWHSIPTRLQFSYIEPHYIRLVSKGQNALHFALYNTLYNAGNHWFPAFYSVLYSVKYSDLCRLEASLIWQNGFTIHAFLALLVAQHRQCKSNKKLASCHITIYTQYVIFVTECKINVIHACDVNNKNWQKTTYTAVHAHRDSETFTHLHI